MIGLQARSRNGRGEMARRQKRSRTLVLSHPFCDETPTHGRRPVRGDPGAAEWMGHPASRGSFVPNPDKNKKYNLRLESERQI
jgi:hypothetical protein